MNAVNGSSWISHTRQTWKLLVAGGLLAITLLGVAGMFLGAFSDNDPLFQGSIPVVLGAGVAGFLWFTLSIGCPACGAKVAWMSLRHESAGAWLTRLLTLRSCPRCGKP
jgi:hypothetical protein